MTKGEIGAGDLKLESQAFSFGQWVKHRRMALGLTRSELAGQVPCSPDTINKIESGLRRPSRQMAFRLAACLNIPEEKRQVWVEIARANYISQRQKAWLETIRPPTNLPISPTPLIGREQDLAAINRQMVGRGASLLTLVGPPGVGKTRLGLQAAASLRDRHEDGVYMVELADIQDPDLVPKVIGQTLGLIDRQARYSKDWLVRVLLDKQILLLLDNFEHLLPASSLVGDLVTSCSQVQLLVTSRIPLRIRAERLYPVQPLVLPDLNPCPPPERLIDFPAVALFLDRARAVSPDFAIHRANGADVAAICHRLDGLPLAIELVAGRILVMSPAQLLARLDDRLLLSSNGLVDLDERQRTLQNAMDWSVNLLSAGEQTLFTCLGVFIGGWTLEAAEAVLDQTTIAPHGQTADLLASLLLKSLIIRRNQAGQVRFAMLETVRQYALNRLRVGGDINAVRRRHAAYYLAMLNELKEALQTSGEIADRIELDHGNFRAALQWSLENADSELVAGLALALHWFWVVRSRHLGEARRWFDKILSYFRRKSLSPLVRANILEAAGILAYLQSDLVAARPLLEEALALARQSGDRDALARTLHSYSNWLMDQGDYEQTVIILEECLPIARELGNNWLIAVALNNLGEVALMRGDVSQAGALFGEGLRLLDEKGNKAFMPILMSGLATACRYQGDHARARELIRNCLLLTREMDDRRIMAVSLENLAALAVIDGRYERAARLLSAAEALRKNINVPVEAIDRADRDRVLGEIRHALAGDAFEQAWSAGQAMTFDQTIRYALDEFE